MADKPIPFSDPMVEALRAGRKTMTRRILDPQPFADGYYEGKVFCDFVPSRSYLEPDCFRFSADAVGGGAVRTEIHEPRYAVGDRLYVREAYYQFGFWVPVPEALTKGGRQKWAFEPESEEIRFDMPEGCRLGRHHKDPARSAWHKRLGRFMPKAASRMTLIVESVKVERLQDISEADALAEGVIHQNVITDTKCYGGNPIEETANRFWNGTEAEDFDGHEYAVDAFADLWGHINGPGAWDANPWCAAISFSVVNSNIDQVAA